MASEGAEDASGLKSLPAKDSLSVFLRDVLNQSFNSIDDLAGTPSLLVRLQAELDRENEEFRKAQANVVITTARGLSYFDLLTRCLQKLAKKIEGVRESSVPVFSLDKTTSYESGNSHSGSASVSWENNSSEASSEWEDLASLEIEGIMNPETRTKDPDESVLNRQAMVEELESLASEVARVEKVRIYAESVLKLEQLVGDLEAAVASVSSAVRSPVQIGGAMTLLKITRAVKIMQTTEVAVAGIANPQWKHLVSAVDLRVDRVAAFLRPAAIADYRSVLAWIGWPPPLSVASAGGHKMANPLLEMREDQERKYCEGFMALTILQAVQQGRRERQLKEYKDMNEDMTNSRSRDQRSRSNLTRAPLWAVEELVTPVAAKAELHFIRWTTNPELVFALGYRIAQEYVDVIDDFLQPLIDSARLAGYSAREEWVFSLVGMVSQYLQTHILPGLANDLQDEGGPGTVAAALWLHIVDQALAFDNRMKSLAVRALGLFQTGSMEETQGEDLENLSGPVALSISAIAERADWLALWAKLELEDVLEKLKSELQNEGAWVARIKSDKSYSLVNGSFQGATGPLKTAAGEFRPPRGADFVLSSMSAVTDRCRSLLEVDQQYTFIKVGVLPIAQEYLQELLRRCQELEAVTALADEASMVKVAMCVNAARFCEYELQEWGEDIFFLSLLQAQKEEDLQEMSPELDGSVFDQEIESLKQFRQDWLTKIVSSISRGFEARCRDYLRNKKRWSEGGRGMEGLDLYSKVDESGAAKELSIKHIDLLDDFYVNIIKGFDVSASLVDSLAGLQSHLRILQATFDDVNFLELWRNVAVALDQLLVSSVIFSGAKFSEHGGWQFAADIQALFLLFKPFCVRPSGFFKTLHDAVLLLTLPSEDALSLLQMLSSSPAKLQDQSDVPLEKNRVFIDNLRHYGIRKLVPSSCKRVLNSRMLPKL